MKRLPPLDTWSGARPGPRLAAFLKSPAIDPAAEETAARALAEIRARGDAAVRAHTKAFNGIDLPPSRFRIPASELDNAARDVTPAFRRAAADTLRRVSRFARAGLRPDWSIRAPRGGRLGERFLPLARVGVYVPGGASPLASTVLMTVPLARAAGVPEIVVCTPCDRGGRVDPHILYAARLAGATEVYRLGGIQAIGAMAYGTKTIRPVDKIVGPGGPFVTAAKRLVYGTVSLDMVAGPSEIAVLADDSARADHIAADLLSQAEHGTGHERTLFVTTDAPLASAVRDELVRQTSTLKRRDVVETVLTSRSRIVVVPDLETGVRLINLFAPEHFELMVRNPRRWLGKIRNAGAVFIGPWTPEPAGDFAAGPSHVLPTGGTARFFSGLTVEDFRRRMSVLELTRSDLADMWPVVEEFGRVEDLEAHARSTRIRFKKV